MDQPLPCLVCGVQPESAFPDWDDNTWQPYGATMFNAGAGHYGSTVWDEFPDSGRSLSINVCDNCLRERHTRVAVMVEHRPRPEIALRPWEPGEDR